MAANQSTSIALGTGILGAVAFIFGVVAENKKPAQGTPIPMKGFVMCKFPNDPTVALGCLSLLALAISAALGLLSVFLPYKGKSVPINAIFHGMTLRVFFVIAVAMFKFLQNFCSLGKKATVFLMHCYGEIRLVTVFAEAMLMWATITEGLHRTHTRHDDMDYACPTAKTGLFGGAAFLALDASLFWLVCQMLTLNARADYLEEDDPKGSYGGVHTTDFDANGAGHP